MLEPGGHFLDLVVAEETRRPLDGVRVPDQVLDAPFIELFVAGDCARDQAAGTFFQLIAEDPRQLGGVEVQPGCSLALSGLIGRGSHSLNVPALGSGAVGYSHSIVAGGLLETS